MELVDRYTKKIQYFSFTRALSCLSIFLKFFNNLSGRDKLLLLPALRGGDNLTIMTLQDKKYIE